MRAAHPDDGSPRPAAFLVEPNVTPMIDVLLVLLIAFMVVVPLSRQAVELVLPAQGRGVSDRVPGRVSPLVLSVERGGRYALNREEVAPDELARRLQALTARVPGRVLFVHGAPDASYQEVIRALDAARGAGVERLALAPRELPRVAR